MRSLHVAALPFPTQQGTQAALQAMLSALHESGQAPELLCYAHGVSAPSPPYVVHRLTRSLGVTSLRSGPSWAKLALDVLLARRLRALVAATKPDWVVAHHVEAALACVAAGISRFAFVAHTSMRDELGFYLPPFMGSTCNRAGAQLDRFLCRKASRVFAVSPLLADELSRQADTKVHVLRLPWFVPPPADAEERAVARRTLGLAGADEVVLYAGNLDAYQGLPVLFESLRRVACQRPRVQLVLATQDTRAARIARELGSLRVHIAPLADERDRRLVHAAADVVAVPRASAGGFPVKLLDALARGARVVAARRAAAGFACGEACTLVSDDDAQAFARALTAQLAARDRTTHESARAYVAHEHDDRAFLSDFSAGLSGCCFGRQARARSFSERSARGGTVP
jgi:glycosyltransferase involved in cell wall biosynthesis